MTDGTRPRRRPAAVAGWTLFALVDLPVLLAVAVGLGAAILPPRLFWWAQLVAVGLPYATWVLVGLAGVPLVARRWGLLAVHVLLIGAVASRALPAGRFAGPDPSPDDLVLMSFNVPQTGPSGEVLGDSMVAFVDRVRPDLLALQDSWVYRREATSTDVPAQVGKL